MAEEEHKNSDLKQYMLCQRV